MNRRTNRLSHRWRKFWQFFCLAGFVFSLVAGGYAISTYTNDITGDSPPPQPPAVTTNSPAVSPPSDSFVVMKDSTAESPAIAPQNATPKQSSNCGSPSGGPTDNAIAAYYSNNPYSWTNKIKWNCVYNIKDFDGASMVDRFNAARDAAAANGGGVVYFPAGTYNFDDSIVLNDGIVMRGDSPSVTDAKSSGFGSPSKLIFPKYEPQLSGNGTPNDTAFKTISTMEVNRDSNIGVVNLDVNRAAISFVGESDRGKNENIVVFGVRSNNVARPDSRVPDTSFQEPWMRYSDRFAANIKINAFANVLVANNRVNDKITDNYEQPGYKVKPVKGDAIVTYAEGDKVPFHYGNHYGIVVNRSKSGGFQPNADPSTEPGLFRKGVTLRDNWVYHTMRVGILASGDGLVIQDNSVKDEQGKQWWTDPTGLKQPRGAVTLENRAIDWSGWNVRVEGNDYQVYRHRIMDTKYLSVDGEGILIQECCGGTKVNGAIVRNNEGNAYIGFYKIPSLQNVEIADNRLQGKISDFPLIYVNADTNNRPSSMENVRIENNTVNGGIFAQASTGGRGNSVTNNQGNNTGSIKCSCHVEVSGNTGFNVEPCLQ